MQSRAISKSDFSVIAIKIFVYPVTQFTGLSVHFGQSYPVFINARRAIQRFASANNVRSCAVFFPNPR